MKIKPILITIVPAALLYLLVVMLLFKQHPSHWLANRSTSFARAVTTLPTLDQSAGLIATTDLLITKSSSPPIVAAGEPLTYTIVVSNTGSDTAYNLTITDVLPAGVQFQGESTLALVKGATPQLHVSLRILTGTVGSLLPTGRVVIIGRTLVETHNNNALLHNTAYVAATNDNNSINNQASIDTFLLTATPTPSPTPQQTALPTASPMATAPTPTATPTVLATTTANQADLQISKSVAPKAVIAGANLTYTFQVNNVGPALAHNIVIQDHLPAGLVFEGVARLTVLRGEGAKLLLTQKELTATVSLLNVTGAITITAPVRSAPTAPTAILVNQATITSTTPDPQPENNHAEAPLTLIAVPPFTESYFLPLIRR